MATNVNALQDTLGHGAREMLTSVFPTHALRWEPRSAFNWSTIIIAYVGQGGWVATAKLEGIFAREILAKTVEFAQTKKDLTTVHVSLVILEPIANLPEHLVTVLLAEMAELV